MVLCVCLITFRVKHGKREEPLQEGSSGQEDETEQTSAAVGENEDKQHHSLQCQEATLATNQDKDLNSQLFSKDLGLHSRLLTIHSDN